ncbi:hypothetical protein [Chryseobacterium sp. JUb7]|uniref:hypothetical protein n=1 Tax=Chryseobacterium sp. JUb7 TaxID=2940599 RepID=UPI002168D8D9|nr:hypothetical protein [Chryseobacterium sp. JUb7]MCS3529421.1 transposase-like protein [Chryseobacterium sp. JUb7]
MTFNEALKCKKKFITDSSNYTQSLYYCLIIPTKEEEAERYIHDFKQLPSNFIDESCKKYTKDTEFRVKIISKKDCQPIQEEILVGSLAK